MRTTPRPPRRPRTDMAQATIPKIREELTIGKMAVGDTGFTVPWAMYADADGLFWLNPDYTLHPVASGTVRMRVHLYTGGYRVDASQAPEHRWSRGPPSYVGAFEPVPVVDFVC